MGVMTALWVAVWWCLLAPHSSSFVTCSVISSCSSQPLWVLCSVHCLVYLAFGWVRFWPAVSTAPVRCGVCSLGCPSCLVLLLTLFVPHLLLRWGGLVTGLWPLCCSCVLGYCGVSVAPLCRLGLLRALPCRVFACVFLWFRGPCSWYFLGLSWGSFLSLPVVTDGLGWLLPALRAGSPTYGWRCVLRCVLVLVAVPPSLRLVLRIRTGFLFYGPSVCVGFNCLLLLCIPSGCGHPLGQ